MAGLREGYGGAHINLYDRVGNKSMGFEPCYMGLVLRTVGVRFGLRYLF